ncbi:hypothetical protein UlMin_000433 [Ulmus minor]
MSEKNHPFHPPSHRVTTEFATVDLVHCNAAFSSGDFTSAIAYFSNAIALARMNLVLYYNRFAAYASLCKYSKTLTDVKKTIEMKLDYPFRDASFGSEMWLKPIANPTTRPNLQQPDFMRLMQEIQKNPNNLNLYLKDQKVMQALGILLNDFDTSIQHYSKVIELDDEDISYIMNRVPTYLDMSKIRIELRSDFKMIAKSLTRKGTALVKLSKCSKDDEPAIKTFQKALTEHRNPETLKKLNDAEKAKKELEQQEYFDLQKADEDCEKVNKPQKYNELVRRIKFYEINYKLNYYILSVSKDTVYNATNVVAGCIYFHINTSLML